MPERSTPPNLVDLSLKALARRVPAAMFRLLGFDVAPGAIRIVDPTVIVKELEADHVFVHESDADQEAWGLYLEYQQEPDRRQLRKWALKALSLSDHLDLDVVLAVLYLRRGDRASFPGIYRASGGSLTNEYRFAVLRLWEHAHRIRGGELPELAPLLVLCEDGPAEQILVEERALIRSANVPPPVRHELLAVAYLLGMRYMTRNVLDVVFGEELPMLKDAGIISDWIEEARAKAAAEGLEQGLERGLEQGLERGLEQGLERGLEQGLERGLEQGLERGLEQGLERGLAAGRVEGRTEGERRALRLLVTKRFGSLPPALAVRIDAADADWCEAFMLHALEVESLQELRY
ncbi:MAG: hypothetical protein ACO1SX_16565 [Actinomycetota bacterium]